MPPAAFARQATVSVSSLGARSAFDLWRLNSTVRLSPLAKAARTSASSMTKVYP